MAIFIDEGKLLYSKKKWSSNQKHQTTGNQQIEKNKEFKIEFNIWSMFFSDFIFQICMYMYIFLAIRRIPFQIIILILIPFDSDMR